jgi:hypothetical protein
LRKKPSRIVAQVEDGSLGAQLHEPRGRAVEPACGANGEREDAQVAERDCSLLEHARLDRGDVDLLADDLEPDRPLARPLDRELDDGALLALDERERALEGHAPRRFSVDADDDVAAADPGALRGALEGSRDDETVPGRPDSQADPGVRALGAVLQRLELGGAQVVRVWVLEAADDVVDAGLTEHPGVDRPVVGAGEVGPHLLDERDGLLPRRLTGRRQRRVFGGPGQREPEQEGSCDQEGDRSKSTRSSHTPLAEYRFQSARIRSAGNAAA